MQKRKNVICAVRGIGAVNVRSVTMELLNNLKLNEKNPRTISKERFEKLKKSLTEFSKMLVDRPIKYDEDFVVWGGNQRLTALRMLVEEGLIKDIDERWFSKMRDDYTHDEKRRFAIMDNRDFGEDDYEMLANEWDDLPLDDWGVDIGDWGKEFDNKEIDTNALTDDLNVVCPKCGFEFENKNE